MRIKVLTLPSFLQHECLENDEDLSFLQPCPVVFNRAGWYRRSSADGIDCWYELHDGRAFKANSGDFDCHLQTLDACRYNARQIDALRECIRQRVATPEQKKLVITWDHAREIARIYRSRWG